ncbi:MAG: single-stranded-DNA-specific exonuclease RecJ [Planctomycetota bacterium]|jgi:single-stranded-DNA-specific exonuclease
MQLSAGMQSKSSTHRSEKRLKASKKQWVIKPLDNRTAQLSSKLKVSPLLAQLLLNRDVSDHRSASSFIRPKLKDLIDPEKMPGIETAVDRIFLAINNKEKITIYGDYDVDGIAGVSILWQILTLLGAKVDYYIPHRIDEGYGLNEEAINSIAQNETSLLVTVDCGITAFKSAELAHKLGLDLIITDHHQRNDKLPKAVAIVHPAIDTKYPNQASSGSMVAFKLAWAVANKFNTGKKLSPELRRFMIDATSLAAMGTIADVMDLRGENRILTSYGLKTIPESNLAGLQQLIETAGLAGQGLDSYHIGFRLAPMLNAAGRMGHARLAVELLTSTSEVRSMQIAQYLKEQNDQRRRIEQKITKHAREMITHAGLNHPDRKTIVLADESWHTGVIGIVASRIIDKYYRPTILINTTESPAQGSARSIPGFDIFKALTACSKHLINYGGHTMAAGITIEPEKIPEFTEALEGYAQENLKQEDIVAKLHIDAAAPLAEFHHGMVEELQMLEPFGQGNPKPLFATKGVSLASPPRRVGSRGDHLQLAITDNTACVRCIGFGMGKLEKKLLEADYFSVAYQPQINTFNGSSNVQFVLEDVKFD